SARRGALAALHDGKEPFEDDALARRAIESRRLRAAEELRPAREERDRRFVGRVPREELLLRAATHEDEAREARRLERLALGDEVLLHRVREREVHVVAAEQEPPPDRDARRLRDASFHRDAEEREV